MIQDRSKLVVLENIHVAAPCHSDWRLMTGDDRVRHCAECDFNVYNLSDMTRTEAEQLIRTHEGRLCVRFFRRADGTIITRNCPRGLEALKRRISRIGAAVFAAMMSVGGSLSWAGPKHHSQAQTEKQGEGSIDLTVVDPTGALIPNAQVQLCKCNNRETTNVKTDSTGLAHFSALKPGDYSLEIQAQGFKTIKKSVSVKAEKIAQLQVKLKVAPQSVTVDVSAQPPLIQGMVVGIAESIESAIPPAPTSPARPSPMRN